MAEVTNELIYEVLKSVQGRIGRVENKLGDIEREIIAVRDHIHALQKDVNNYIKVSETDSRVAKIERRLDIIDQPAE